MSTTYSANLKLGTPAANDSGWAAVLDRNRALMDGLSPIGSLAVTPAEVPSASLNVAVSGGIFGNASGVVAAYTGTPSLAIPASSTQVLYLDNSGTLQVAAAWPTGTPHIPLAVVVAGATTITSVTDARVVCMSVTR